MRARRGATDLAGIIPVDKPAGMTSHDVVAAVRRATGEGRVGHAGTLDPMATGLLVVLVGPYTRLEPFLSAAEKSYEATITFGACTDTDDAEGEVTGVASVPLDLLDPGYAQAALDTLVGASMQVPPAYSAIKLDGRVAHRAARAGEALEIAARPVEVFEASLAGVRHEPPAWDVSLRVSKGTYVRALARDLGAAYGTLAHLTALRRTASGALRIAQASTLAEVEAAGREGLLAELFADPLATLALPVVEGAADDVACGRPLDAPGAGPDGERFAVTVAGRLGGVYHRDGGRLKPDAIVLGAGS